jgi:hypothetical protein
VLGRFLSTNQVKPSSFSVIKCTPEAVDGRSTSTARNASVKAISFKLLARACAMFLNLTCVNSDIFAAFAVTVECIKHPFADCEPLNLTLNLNPIGFNRHFDLRVDSKIVFRQSEPVETLRYILIAVLKNELLEIRHRYHER